MSLPLSAAEKIHQASLEILENPGVKLQHEETVGLFLKNGARPGADNETIRIPREMIEEYLRLCPSEFGLADRVGNEARISPAGAPAIWSCPGLNLYERGETRRLQKADLAALARLFDRLENVHGVFGTSMKDVLPAASDVVGLATMAQNTRKHIRAFCFTPEGGRVMAEMKQVIGRHAWFSIGFTAHGPLRWTQLALEIFQSTSGHGIPVTVNGEPMCGTSAPVTVAGAAAVGNAEILAGILAIQLMEPGRPCIYNLGLAHLFDMRTMVAITGGPENALLAEIAALMGRYYNLPSGSWVSTESMAPDSQAALEKMFGFHTHMAGGVSNIWGVGQLESEMTLSPAQAVIDDEIISYLRRYRRGFSVDDDALAVDVIREVGICGEYLGHEHTAEHFREEIFDPQLLFRRKRADWESAGGLRLDEVAEQKARELMNCPPESGMTEDQSRELLAIADRFANSLQ